MSLNHYIISICALFASAIIGMIVRRMMRRRWPPPKPPDENFDFSMDELARLLAAGQITRQEYERLKEQTLARRTPPPDQRHVGFEVLPPRDHI